MSKSKPKLAVIGASHFQLPLIQKAQQMGCEVHAFAWECGDVGEKAADVFHPVSIVETNAIVDACKEVGIDGICTIASDLATVAVCTVADALGLVGNSIACMNVSTNKNLMRKAFASAGDPSPRSVLVHADEQDTFNPATYGLQYPLIVKPTDRSGSRGITKLETPYDADALQSALQAALEQSFAKEALVEEFATGDEFSVEGISWKGEHRILTITRKGTTGAPHFIETAHLQPCGLSDATQLVVREVVTKALDTLGVEYGASHSELKVASDGTVRIIEIGARMGGDCIGSHMVQLSTGIDYLGAVVDVALGHEPDLTPSHSPAVSAARFLFNKDDLKMFKTLQQEHPELVRYSCMTAEPGAHEVLDSSTRLGHFVMAASEGAALAPYLPNKLARVAEAL